MICYPDKLYEVICRWIELGSCRNFVCTLKFQAETDHATAAKFAPIPGSRLMHLSCNQARTHVGETGTVEWMGSENQPRNVGRGTLEKRAPLPQIYERGAHLSLSKDFWAYPISLHSPFRHRLPWEEPPFRVEILAYALTYSPFPRPSISQCSTPSMPGCRRSTRSPLWFSS